MAHGGAHPNIYVSSAVVCAGETITARCAADQDGRLPRLHTAKLAAASLACTPGCQTAHPGQILTAAVCGRHQAMTVSQACRPVAQPSRSQRSSWVWSACQIALGPSASRRSDQVKPLLIASWRPRGRGSRRAGSSRRTTPATVA